MSPINGKSQASSARAGRIAHSEQVETDLRDTGDIRLAILKRPQHRVSQDFYHQYCHAPKHNDDNCHHSSLRLLPPGEG